MESAGGQKDGADPVSGFRIAGVSGQPGQLANHFGNGPVGVDEAAVVGADGFDGFRYQAPGFIGRLGQVALGPDVPKPWRGNPGP